MFIIFQTSYIIVYHHTSSYQVLIVTLVYGFKSQDSPALSSPYLGLKAIQPCWVVKTVQSCWVFIWGSKVVQPYQALNRSRIVPDVYIRQVRLSRVTPRDLCHLAWLVSVRPSSSRITRPTSAQERRFGCVQPTGHSLPLGDAWGWSSLMPWQVDDLQIPKRNILPALYIDARVRKVRKSRVRRRRSQVGRSRGGPETLNESQTQWGVVVEVKPTRVKSGWLLLRDFYFGNSPF